MSSHFNAQPTDMREIVRSLSVRTRMAPGDLAVVFSELPDNQLVAYRACMLGHVWPEFLATLHLGDEYASNLPEVYPYLVRAYLASYCHVTGLPPSVLADAASSWSHEEEPSHPGPASQAAAPSMLQEIADHFSLVDTPLVR